MRLFALAVSAVFVATPTVAQQLISDDRIKALAGLVVYDCGLTVDDRAAAEYAVSTFEDSLAALSAYEWNVNALGYGADDLAPLDLTIRCAALRQFAENENLLAD